LQEWESDVEGPFKLIIPLSHLYTSQSLSFATFKTEDKAAADLLTTAAAQGRAMVYLALLTCHEEEV